MERNIERKTLSFSKGMTNTQSDLVCSDDELDMCIGLTYKNGGWVPIRTPKKIGSIPYLIKYVHKGADFENIIAYDKKEKKIHWYFRLSDGGISIEQGEFYIGELTDIKSVGNTLVCATDKGLHYLLYKNKTYEDLGTDLPTVNFTPRLSEMNYLSLGGTTVCNLEGMIESAFAKFAKIVYNEDGTLNGIEETSDVSVPGGEENYYGWKVSDDADKADSFKNATIGHYNAALKKIKEKNRFSFPFFVRCAMKLFDGSYTRISAPILLFPSINRNCKFVPVRWNNNAYEEYSYKTYLYQAFINYATLQFKAEVDGIGNWGDIVKGLVVFASDEVNVLDMEEGFHFARATEVDGEAYINYVNSDNKYKVSSGIELPDSPVSDTRPIFKFTKTGYRARDVLMPTYKSDNEIKDELLSRTQFYKLFEISIDGGYINKDWLTAPLKSHVVENLTTQEQLKVDDYYSWTKVVAGKLYEYNKRLNAFGLQRSFFDGFNNMGMYSGLQTTRSFTYYTRIEVNAISTWVKSKEVSVFYPQCGACWLYYPDPNAKEMIIWDSVSSTGMRVKLTEHPMLNGAYYFGNLPTEDTFIGDSSISIPTVESDIYQSFDSQIFTSVVNNPFVFEASGDNTVGTGKIVGIAANTEAVSQGQFGQYPLLVFTTEGIYGMAVDSEGLYSATYPISREVCYEDSAIVPTDKMVLFASPKGLMAASGGGVTCLTPQMQGFHSLYYKMVDDGEDRSEEEKRFLFLNFIKNASMAYDYKNSLLYIFKNTEDPNDNVLYYVYNLESNTLSCGSILNCIKDYFIPKVAINDYPDYLVQSFNDGDVFSFAGMEVPPEEDKKYYVIVFTRPLKLGGSIKLKSLRDLKHITDGVEDMEVSIGASNDCKNWRYLKSLGGKPWKYYCILYIMMVRGDGAFLGSIAEVQTRRNDKIR